MTRPRGRAFLGTRLVCQVPHWHWKTTTFLAALRVTGLTAPLVVDGAINGDLFRGWVEQHLVPTLRAGDIVVIGTSDRAALPAALRSREQSHRTGLVANARNHHPQSPLPDTAGLVAKVYDWFEQQHQFPTAALASYPQAV